VGIEHFTVSFDISNAIALAIALALVALHPRA
jgi:hypothetical protein